MDQLARMLNRIKPKQIYATEEMSDPRSHRALCFQSTESPVAAQCS